VEKNTGFSNRKEYGWNTGRKEDSRGKEIREIREMLKA
jgi:hypothetical protein